MLNIKELTYQDVGLLLLLLENAVHRYNDEVANYCDLKLSKRLENLTPAGLSAVAGGISKRITEVVSIVKMLEHYVATDSNELKAMTIMERNLTAVALNSYLEGFQNILQHLFHYQKRIQAEADAVQAAIHAQEKTQPPQ